MPMSSGTECCVVACYKSLHGSPCDAVYLARDHITPAVKRRLCACGMLCVAHAELQAPATSVACGAWRREAQHAACVRAAAFAGTSQGRPDVACLPKNCTKKQQPAHGQRVCVSVPWVMNSGDRPAGGMWQGQGPRTPVSQPAQVHEAGESPLGASDYLRTYGALMRRCGTQQQQRATGCRNGACAGAGGFWGHSCHGWNKPLAASTRVQHDRCNKQTTDAQKHAACPACPPSMRGCGCLRMV